MGNQEKRSEEGFNRDFSGPKPVETGKEYEVQIIEISRKVYGIARAQGFVIFVKSGQVGQNEDQQGRKHLCYSRNCIGLMLNEHI